MSWDAKSKAEEAAFFLVQTLFLCTLNPEETRRCGYNDVLHFLLHSIYYAYFMLSEPVNLINAKTLFFLPSFTRNIFPYANFFCVDF